MIRKLLWPRYMSLINQWKKSSKTEKRLISVFAVFGILFWAALFALFWWGINTMYGVEIGGPFILRKLLDILMLSLFGLLCFSSTVTALSSFYLSEDLELLLSLPISRAHFFFGRMIDTLMQSAWMPIVLALPILISYGIVYGAGWHFYPIMLLSLLMFTLIPCSIGILVSSILVSAFPARRIRESLMIVGVVAMVTIFIWLRSLRPERLANTENFESVADYVAELQTPLPLLSPPSWSAKVILATLSGQTIPLLELGLLVSGAFAFVGVARWVSTALYDDGRSKAQEARVARMAKSNLLNAFIRIWTKPLAPLAKVIVSKDIRCFLRDPAQWTQIFLVGSIVVIALISVAALPVETFKGPWMRPWINALSFLILALVGFVMAALAARFQFSAVSIEGRGFWVIRTSPISADEYLKSKLWPGLVPMFVVGELLAVSSSAILRAEPALIGTAIFTAAGLSIALSGLAVGMGAMYPDFKADNASKLAASPSGVLYMVFALSAVFGTLILESYPVYLFISSSLRQVPLQTGQIVIISFFAICTMLLWYACYRIPMQYGARMLWEREI
jgi:ABC-2 type transport system permease protein